MNNQLLTFRESRMTSSDPNKYHWTSLPDMVWDADECGFSDREQMLRILNEFRTEYSMSQFYFRSPEDGQSNDPEDSYTWGPNPITEVDWTGFSSAIKL